MLLGGLERAGSSCQGLLVALLACPLGSAALSLLPLQGSDRGDGRMETSHFRCSWAWMGRDTVPLPPGKPLSGPFGRLWLWSPCRNPCTCDQVGGCSWGLQSHMRGDLDSAPPSHLRGRGGLWLCSENPPLGQKQADEGRGPFPTHRWPLGKAAFLGVLRGARAEPDSSPPTLSLSSCRGGQAGRPPASTGPLLSACRVFGSRL